MRRPVVPSVDPVNLSGAQLIALAQSRIGLRPRPVAPPISRGPFVETPAAITPTDRARKAIQLAIRHVGLEEVAALVAELLPVPEPVAPVAAAVPAAEPVSNPEPVAPVAAAVQ